MCVCVCMSISHVIYIRQSSSDCLAFNFEGRSRNVILTPFNDHDVLSAIFDHVVDVVDATSSMFYVQIVNGSFGSVDTDIQNVAACEVRESLFFVRRKREGRRKLTSIEGIQVKCILLANVGFFQAHTLGYDFSGI